MQVELKKTFHFLFRYKSSFVDFIFIFQIQREIPVSFSKSVRFNEMYPLCLYTVTLHSRMRSVCVFRSLVIHQITFSVYKPFALRVFLIGSPFAHLFQYKSSFVENVIFIFDIQQVERNLFLRFFLTWLITALFTVLGLV